MKRLFAISCLLVTVVIFVSQPTDAQEPDVNSNSFAPPEADPFDTRPIRVNSPAIVREGKQFKIRMGAPNDSRDAIRQIAEKLRDADSDEEKDNAQAELRRLLTDYFEKDMQRRKTELDEMEKRLARLRDQLSRRHTKMDEIVDLQIKVLINEADGMGFFSSGPAPFERRIDGLLGGNPQNRDPYFYAPNLSPSLPPVMVDAANVPIGPPNAPAAPPAATLPATVQAAPPALSPAPTPEAPAPTDDE
jgi:hypothetical protein